MHAWIPDMRQRRAHGMHVRRQMGQDIRLLRADRGSGHLPGKRFPAAGDPGDGHVHGVPMDVSYGRPRARSAAGDRRLEEGEGRRQDPGVQDHKVQLQVQVRGFRKKGKKMLRSVWGLNLENGQAEKSTPINPRDLYN